MAITCSRAARIRKELSTLQESRATDYPTSAGHLLRFSSAAGPVWADAALVPHSEIDDLFLQDFGSDLAPMATYLPTGKSTDVRAAARMRNGGGYLLFNNYQRHISLPDHDAVQVMMGRAARR